MTVFGVKLGKNAPNMAFFGALRANRGTFLLIYSKSAENKMSFEIHVTTIATGSLSFFEVNSTTINRHSSTNPCPE